MSKRAVRCPAAECGRTFELDAERLGRSTRCPACGVRMTARPLEVESLLREQERRLLGADGAALPRLPFAVLVDNVRSLWNVGSIFRTADGCGAAELALAGITGYPPRPEIAKTALGAERAVRWRYHADPLQALHALQRSGFEPVALENAPGAQPPESLDWPSPLCLVVGNEVSGISPAVLEACPRRVHIPMHGVKNTLNVAVAFGIAAYHAACALRLHAAPAARRGVCR